MSPLVRYGNLLFTTQNPIIFLIVKLDVQWDVSVVAGTHRPGVDAAWGAVVAGVIASLFVLSRSSCVPGHGKSDHQESNTPQGRILSLGAVR